MKGMRSDAFLRVWAKADFDVIDKENHQEASKELTVLLFSQTDWYVQYRGHQIEPSISVA